MATYNKFNSFVQFVCNGNFNLGSDTLKVGLSNTTPTAAGTTYSTSITEIASGSGYVAGGTSLGGVVSTQSSGTETLSANNASWTASGGNMTAFEFVVLYDSTAAANNLIAWWDYGTSFTLTNGNTFTVQFNGGSASGSIFTMS